MCPMWDLTVMSMLHLIGSSSRSHCLMILHHYKLRLMSNVLVLLMLRMSDCGLRCGVSKCHLWYTLHTSLACVGVGRSI